MKIVSACLAGIPCRWDGKAKPCQQILQLVENQEAIPLCPEELGGLTTPREQAEIQQDGSVKTINGNDVTEKYLAGAQKVLELAKLMGCREVIFKSKSPSCGCGKIFDGTFSETLIAGDGICTKLLKDNHIKVITEENLQ
ncbi:MAG: DUF523 domain-containing protein [candidate division SR1 bacterium]|nr:DUF523 domain-containing protein [candidate division SR1 bacterium]